MGDGLKRAAAAAKASGRAKCPVCGKPVTLRMDSGRIPLHGPQGNRCRGSLRFPGKAEEA